MAGLLKQGESEWALPPLDDARVTKIDARGILIVGMEQLKGRDPTTTECADYRAAPMKSAR